MTSISRFTHPFLPQSEAQINSMLKTIGISSINELFQSIPEKLRFQGKLDIPDDRAVADSIPYPLRGSNVDPDLASNKESNADER